jgi:Na+-transporting NADH:ubiquinone oxidoreductase subunit NqrB
MRDFSLRPAQIVLTFGAGLLAQSISWRFNPPKSRSFRSAIITSFSLALLLRADNLAAHPLAAVAAIASKSIFRARGKHLFNPATFGIMSALCLLPGTWVSAGQWGSDLAAGGWMLALGMLVTARARRADIS